MKHVLVVALIGLVSIGSLNVANALSTQDLAAQLSKSANIPQDQATKEVERVIGAIKYQLKNGNAVEVPNFGKFALGTSKGKTTQAVPNTQPKRYAKFKAAKEFNNELNQSTMMVSLNTK